MCLSTKVVFLKKLFDDVQYQNLFEFVQKEHEKNVMQNAIYCKMTEDERWAKCL